jgi:hypothetical protein
MTHIRPLVDDLIEKELDRHLGLIGGSATAIDH